MTDTDVTTIRLPHTGLHVPDDSLSVAAYRQHQTRDGIAFTASLRVNCKKVGLIENDGHGGETGFFPDYPTSYGSRQIKAYAAQCRTEQGDPVIVEQLLEKLVDERQTAKWVADCDRKGQLALRMMDHSLVGEDNLPIAGFPPDSLQMMSSNKPANEAQTKALAEELLAKYPPSVHGWWQMWNGTGWHDISPRPDREDKELYG